MVNAPDGRFAVRRTSGSRTAQGQQRTAAVAPDSARRGVAGATEEPEASRLLGPAQAGTLEFGPTQRSVNYAEVRSQFYNFDPAVAVLTP